MEAKFPVIFTDKGLTEFDLEYGLKREEIKTVANGAQGKNTPAQERENGVPNAKLEQRSEGREWGGTEAERVGEGTEEEC